MLHDDATKGALWLATLGAAVGLGQLLTSKEPLTIRLVAGRALVSGGLGMAAAAIIAIMPALPFAAQLGIAAMFASLGTSALEKFLNRVLGGS